MGTKSVHIEPLMHSCPTLASLRKRGAGASLDKKSNEHKVGAHRATDAQLSYTGFAEKTAPALVDFYFSQEGAMRFQDQTQIEVLDCMRTPSGKRFTRAQWDARFRLVLVCF